MPSFANIKSISQLKVQEKESLVAALKVIALGENDRMQGKGISASESRAQLAAVRHRRK